MQKKNESPSNIPNESPITIIKMDQQSLINNASSF